MKMRFLSLAAAIVLVCACVMPLYCSAADTGVTYYFDSDAGSDSNSGTSEKEALRSLSKLTALPLDPGDSVLFKCGCTFTGTGKFSAMGTEGRHITVGSYGEGAKPVLTTDSADIVLEIVDSCFLDVKGLEITAPADGGRGLYIVSKSYDSHDITVSDMTFHNISNYNTAHYACSDKACLELVNEKKTDGISLHDITVSSCEFYDCSYGLSNDGPDFDDESSGAVRTHDVLVTGCSFHDIWDDAVIITGMNRFTLADSSIIMTCISTEYYTAPAWMAECDSCVVTNCEVAGSLNYMDGMTVDFDTSVTNSTYERIYSHDNARFLWGIARDKPNSDNTVRYCLSVNDSVTSNGAARKDGLTHTIDNFKFYNNTIIDGTYFDFSSYKNAVIANNIFCLYDGMYVKGRTDDTFTDNIWYGKNVMFPGGPDWKGNVFCDPLFVNADDRDTKDGFMLRTGSPALGAGEVVEEDMGGYDLWGDPLGDTHNIGCYEGVGIPESGSFAAGDADGSGRVDAADAREALRTAIGLDSPNKVITAACDVDGSGSVTADDARAILRLSIGLN